jgi:HlyD family secretion protein
MTRRSLIVGLVTLAILVVAGYVVWLQSNTKTSDVLVAGDVRVVEQIVTAPAIAQPSPDVAVGISATPTAGAASRSPGAGGQSMSAASRTPVVSGFLSEVLVSQGDRVTKGQVVARLDTTMLDLGVAQAAAAARKTRADVAVLDSNLDTLDTACAKLISGRAKLRTARASLETKLPLLLRQRASLEASITAIERIIAQPGGPPPGNPPLPMILAKMKAGLAGLNKGIAGIKSGLAQMSQALAKMKTGLAQIDSARTKLRDLRGVLLAHIETRDAALRAAQTRREQATIVAPVDGLVLFARSPGTVAMVGAPLVRIRPDGPTQVQTYLTGEQLAAVRSGTPVSITYDSATGPALSGVISAIGDESHYPPTSFPTGIVHMTRAVRVTITLDEGKGAPPGTPVDIVVRTGQSR